MGRLISLSQTFGEDADQVKAALMLFGGKEAEVVGVGRRKVLVGEDNSGKP